MMSEVCVAVVGLLICVGAVASVTVLMSLVIWWMMRNDMEWDDLEDWEEGQ